MTTIVMMVTVVMVMMVMKVLTNISIDIESWHFCRELLIKKM